MSRERISLSLSQNDVGRLDILPTPTPLSESNPDSRTIQVSLSLLASHRGLRSRRGCRGRARNRLQPPRGPSCPRRGRGPGPGGRPQSPAPRKRGDSGEAAPRPALRAARRGGSAPGDNLLCSPRGHAANSQTGGGDSTGSAVSESRSDRREGGAETGNGPLSHPRASPGCGRGDPGERRRFLGALSGPLLRQVVGRKRTKLPVKTRGGPRAPQGRGRPSPRRPVPGPPRARPRTPGPRAQRRPLLCLPSRLLVRGEAALPKGRAAGWRGSVRGGVCREAEEGGRPGGGGAGRGAGAPLMSRAGLGTDCQPAAISLCHGSGLLATAASPAAPSRASCLGLNSARRARRAAAAHKSGAGAAGGAAGGRARGGSGGAEGCGRAGCGMRRT